MLGHVASFFSVSYFDQINVFLYLIIGMIAVFAQERKREGYESEPQKSQDIVQLST